jgi:putative membrane protein
MPDEKKQALAEDRTDLAEDRTVLANERTYAGWMRTGFAAVGIGLGFNALFNKMEPTWIPKSIATAFLLIAIAIFIGSERRACSVINRLKAHQVKTVEIRNLRIVNAAIIIATLALIASIWFLRLEDTSGA